MLTKIVNNDEVHSPHVNYIVELDFLSHAQIAVWTDVTSRPIGYLEHPKTILYLHLKYNEESIRVSR